MSDEKNQMIKRAGIARAIMGEKRGPSLEERAHMLSQVALDPLNRLVHGERPTGGLRGAAQKAKEAIHGRKQQGLVGLAQTVKGQAERAREGLLYGTEAPGLKEQASEKRKALNVAAGPLGKPLSHYVGEEKKKKPQPKADQD